MKLVFENKATPEKAVEAVDAVQDALYEALGPVPLVVALGVLRLVEHALIEEHGQ